MNQVEAKPALEELLHEARVPFLLARRLGDFARFLLAGRGRSDGRAGGLRFLEGRGHVRLFTG
jgi:hypothetical protein